MILKILKELLLSVVASRIKTANKWQFSFSFEGQDADPQEGLMPDNVELVYLQCESFEEVEQVLNYTLTPQQRCDSWVVQGDDNDWTIFYPRAITPAPKPINVEESAILREVRDIINNLPDKER